MAQNKVLPTDYVPSKTFGHDFMHSHDELKMMSRRPIEPDRIEACSKEKLQAFFEDVKKQVVSIKWAQTLFLFIHSMTHDQSVASIYF